ncbi:MAG: DnaD domain protein [Clostridia bacterium]|nr:DnaD domain protein [Clostridia bacterium]
MQIRVNPALQWGAVFSVPAAVADQYLKLASAEQLRALLWVLRHAAEQPTVEQAAKALRQSEQNMREYIAFWQQKEILLTDAPTVPAQRAPVEEAKPVKKELPELPESKPSADEILRRVLENPDLDFLFKEAQKKFGRTIGYDGQCTLLLMHDRYGLPIDVILILIQYCADVRKTAYGYIAAMGRTWGQEEIDTIEKAAEKIDELRRCGKLWSQLASTAGLTAPTPTPVQSEYLRVWSDELGYGIEMIALAYEEMSNHCRKLSFPYMNKVLHTWHSKGLKTPQEVAEDNRLFREKKQKEQEKEKDGDKPPASYDIDEMEHRLLYGPIVYKKND